MNPEEARIGLAIRWRWMDGYTQCVSRGRLIAWDAQTAVVMPDEGYGNRVVFVPMQDLEEVAT